LARGRETRTRLTPAPLPQAPLDDAQRLACLRLIRSDNVGPITFRELINHFGGAEPALAALPELSRRGGRRQAIRICPRETAEAELDAADRIGARPLFTIEPGYPPALAALDAPPPLLYIKGNAGHLARPMLAIVGARNGSAAGQKLARLFASRIGAAGFVIASGLARGIDGAAHEAALDTGTVAVLAGGPDNVYPPEHEKLQRAIAERGCLVTENPPGFVPRAQDFPRPNRIISGVALAVLIVEASRRSGTLITARMAGEQGREVFAVPGHPLDPRAEGTNGLLKSGATLVTEPDDILGALAPQLAEPLPRRGLGEATGAPGPPHPHPGRAMAEPHNMPEADRARLVEALGPAPVDIDELGRVTGLSPRALQIALLELSLAGRIERHGHQLVSLREG
jgi:DNA processing protein